ncbi:reverse transcriptase-like protein [Alkalihalobacillus trypoxylicola]|uniref:RNase H type-1 domain-containing protein n=1 Tax=Alkalihalobacillus trypoxylicola TaxID=519424 RepID=A0A162F681_9BACI|nr:reverse transcriptase-like protein [Alkalihalobacillus trypoxylicola]KYG34875.1 hypothetical protein AZF04_00650 [Alkalihalobacillus trypoxylicola]
MELRLEWNYKPLKHHQSFKMESEWLTIDESISLKNDLEKTGRAKDMNWYDRRGVVWSNKDLSKLKEELFELPHNVTSYFDASFDKESKKSGLGYVLYFQQNGQEWRVRANQKQELLTDNNESEYSALYALLAKCEELEIKHQLITVQSDSMVVIHQMTDEWPVYEEHYLRWYNRIKEKQNKLGLSIDYQWIPREKNKEADKLAAQALKNEEIDAKLPKNKR